MYQCSVIGRFSTVYSSRFKMLRAWKGVGEISIRALQIERKSGGRLKTAAPLTSYFRNLLTKGDV